MTRLRVAKILFVAFVPQNMIFLHPEYSNQKKIKIFLMNLVLIDKKVCFDNTFILLEENEHI